MLKLMSFVSMILSVFCQLIPGKKFIISIIKYNSIKINI